MKKSYLEMPAEHLTKIIELIEYCEPVDKTIEDLVDRFFNATDKDFTFSGMNESAAYIFVEELRMAFTFLRNIKTMENMLPSGFSLSTKK